MSMTRTRIASGLAGALLALATAAPMAAAGGAPVMFDIEDSYTVEHACGIVEHTTLRGRGRAFFDAQGNWLRDVLTIEATGTFVNTTTGATYAGRSHQNAIAAPGVISLSGQGIFLRGPGGVLNFDVGRLVFEPGTMQTLFASPKVMRFDDPETFAALERAICEALG